MSAPFIHPTAIVEPGAEIGDGARVWHHAHVMAGARVGCETSLGKDVFVAGGARLGDRVKVQNGVSIYDGVDIDDDVFIGPHAVFTNVRAPRAFISRRAEIEPTRVERGASIGAGAVIVCGNTVGAYAFVGAGAVVTEDVPAHALVVGNPARRIGWVSRAGRQLPPGRLAACPESGERYVVDGGGCTPLEPGAIEEQDAIEPVPFQDLAEEHAPLEPELTAAFRRVVASGRFVLGEEVERLEAELAARVGVPHAVGVSSGSDALLLALTALGIGPGDEVVTTPFSFFATAGSIARLGAKPVFADIDPVSFNLEPGALRAALSPNTRAIVVVHLFGRPCDLEIFDLAERAGVPVVEDAAQALGATTPRGAAGALGTLGCFSFFPTKNLGALGDAGLVTTRDPVLADRVRLLRAQGARPRYHHVLLGGNHRMDALQAALLRVKHPHLDAWTAARRDNARAYEEALAPLVHSGQLVTPGLSEGHVFHQYVVRSPERDALRAGLAERQIASEIYYPEPLHLQPCFEALGYAPGSMPVAEKACSEVLALPVFAGLGAARWGRVVEGVREERGRPRR